VILDDARNALLTSREQYDLIISEPSNPWIAGVSSLFTDEFYAAARGRLAPGGLFVQWVQGYSLEPSDLQMILATIVPHFLDVTLWHSAGADFLIVARTESAPLDFVRARALWSDPLLREDFSTLRLARPESWPVYFSLSDAEVRALAAGGDRNTDDRTLLERANSWQRSNAFRTDCCLSSFAPRRREPPSKLQQNLASICIWTGPPITFAHLMQKLPPHHLR
jgi:spermidine synthase